MKNSFDIRKISAVVLYIIQQSGGEIDFVSLFKKMYFAQQQSLAMYGRALVPDSFRAVKLGPVPSFTYRALRYSLMPTGEVTEELKDFASAFTVTELDNGVKYVKANEQPKMSSLSKIEISILDDVLKSTEGMDSKQLSEKSHDAAWITARRRSAIDATDNYMSPVRIAKAGGASKETVDYIKETQAFAQSYCQL